MEIEIIRRIAELERGLDNLVMPELSTGITVQNTSGGAVTANSVGYLDAAGEFKLSSVGYEDVNWVVVTGGGADNADIAVVRRGRVTIELTADCAIGDFLYMANSAGNQHRARPETYMRPEMFAVALSANSTGAAGGTCSALLYCHTKFVAKKDALVIYGLGNSAETNFRAQISGIAGAVVTWNAVGVVGNGNCIDPGGNNYHAKLRLYNETDADYALIDDVNVGARQITLTAAVPVGWAIGEWVTARSQTCIDPAPPPYYFDLDLSSADNTVVPVLARSIFVQVFYQDSAAANIRTNLHPWQAFGLGNRVSAYCQVAGIWKSEHVPMPLIQRRFCHEFQASGAATAAFFLYLAGYWEAAP